MHTLFFVVAVLAIRAIYRLRAYLGAAIERWGAASGSGLARYLPWRAFSSIGHHVARRLGGPGLPRLGAGLARGARSC